MTTKFRLGLLINPIAGVGGSVALKGSDGLAQQALAMGAEPLANIRTAQALAQIAEYKTQLTIVTASGMMGAELASALGFDTEVIYSTPSITSATDTHNVAKALLASDLDLLLFAGGDGTARDIYAVVADLLPVLGVPAGVKIHSGVYGVTPVAAGLVVKMLLSRELVSLMLADVMDIDEVAFRQQRVIAKRFGEMLVPAEPRYVQAVKMGGRESSELVLADIAADVIEQIDDEMVIVGSGTTVAAVMTELALDNTLLGIDVIDNHRLIATDVNANELANIVTKQLCQGRRPKLLLTVIGGQGHILGRGNQQLSPKVMRLIKKEDIILVASKTKLTALGGRPLIVDSGDPELDKKLSGYYRVICGYHDDVMYQVASPKGA